MVLTTPSTHDPMTVWLRKPPHESVGYLRAHLTPLCHFLADRIGTPSTVTATHVRDKSYLCQRVHWSWRVRIDHPLAHRRTHITALLCSHCLDNALAERLIPEPPPAPWFR